MQVGVATYVYDLSAYPLLSAYFLTTYCYKRMRLITRVYGTMCHLTPEWLIFILINKPVQLQNTMDFS